MQYSTKLFSLDYLAADENAQEPSTEADEVQPIGDDETAPVEGEQMEEPPKDEEEDKEATEKTEEQQVAEEAPTETEGEALDGVPQVSAISRKCKFEKRFK